MICFSAKSNFRANSLDPVQQLSTPVEGYLVFLDGEEAVLIYFVFGLGGQEAGSDLFQLNAFFHVLVSGKYKLTDSLSRFRLADLELIG